MDREPSQHLSLACARARSAPNHFTGPELGGCPCNIWAFLRSVMKHDFLIPQRHRRKPLQENLAATEGGYMIGQKNDKKNTRMMNRKWGGGDILITLQD